MYVNSTSPLLLCLSQWCNLLFLTVKLCLYLFLQRVLSITVPDIHPETAPTCLKITSRNGKMMSHCSSYRHVILIFSLFHNQFLLKEALKHAPHFFFFVYNPLKTHLTLSVYTCTAQSCNSWSVSSRSQFLTCRDSVGCRGAIQQITVWL